MTKVVVFSMIRYSLEAKLDWLLWITLFLSFPPIYQVDNAAKLSHMAVLWIQLLHCWWNCTGNFMFEHYAPVRTFTCLYLLAARWNVVRHLGHLLKAPSGPCEVWRTTTALRGVTTTITGDVERFSLVTDQYIWFSYVSENWLLIYIRVLEVIDHDVLRWYYL